MRVKLEYIDNEAYTIDEVIAQARHHYGSGVSVKIMPESTRPHDLVEFAIKAFITENQVSYYFDDQYTYKNKMQKLKEELLKEFGESIDSVIKDNEKKLKGD